MPDAGRVIAGSARGIRLQAPGPGTRPLGDRVKQTLFAILEPDLPGARVLDLFAGSGAAGIEALSRGAAAAVFVERDAAGGRGHRRRTSGRSGSPSRPGPSSFAPTSRHSSAARPTSTCRSTSSIVDPPYADVELRDRVLDLARRAGRAVDAGAPGSSSSTSGATSRRPRVGLLASERARRFGETALTFYRRQEDG